MDTLQSGTPVPELGKNVPKPKRKRNVREILEMGLPRQLRMVCDGYGMTKKIAAAIGRTDRAMRNYINGDRKPCFTDLILLARAAPLIRKWVHAMVHAPAHDLERLNAEAVSLGWQLERAEDRFAYSLALEPGAKPSFRRTALAALKAAGKTVRHPIQAIRRRKAVAP